jgi:hypothetical protein
LSANAPPVNEPTVAPARSVLTTHPAQDVTLWKSISMNIIEEKAHFTQSKTLERRNKYNFTHMHHV